MLLQPFSNVPGRDAKDTYDFHKHLSPRPLFIVGLHLASCFGVLQYLDVQKATLNGEWERR